MGAFYNEIATQKRTITDLKEENITLQSQVEYLKRRLWGKSSERHINNNLSSPCLFTFDDMELTEEEKRATEEAVQEITDFREKTIKIKLKGKPVRKTLPEHLPRREEHIYPDIPGIDNKEMYDELSPEITEILEHEPGKFYVRKIIRHKYVLKTVTDDRTSPVVTASLPALPLPKSYAGSTLLAEISVNKYVYHISTSSITAFPSTAKYRCLNGMA